MNKEQFFSLCKPKVHEREIDGNKFYFKTMSVAQAKTIRKDDDFGDIKLLKMSLCDSDGNCIFNDDDDLTGIEQAFLMKLLQHAVDVNGFKQESLDEAKKN